MNTGWDGIWASLAGGLLSGVTVVGGVFLAQWLVDKRREAAQMRTDADALVRVIFHVRDAAVKSRRSSRSGTYDLWPLRHQILLSHTLREYPIMEAVQSFTRAVEDLRHWVRYGPFTRGNPAVSEAGAEGVFESYAVQLYIWADLLIEHLQLRPTEIGRPVAVVPELPELRL